ncbi:hypothetical protein ACIQZD_24270 [Peribacillus sp. NPDC096447]|uniref:hypothetical protein n=1 Tax=Peribacillus sp. NPDC096447 TaxID=3364394 RepID=UPI00381DA596
MKLFGVALLFSGINLMGLSGLEKVLIFLAYNGDIHQIQAILDLTPTYIWGITNFTFGFGLVLFIVGVGVFLKQINTKNGEIST